MSDEELFKAAAPPEVPRTCLGLDLTITDDIGVPLAALVVVRHYVDGQVFHSLGVTDEVSDVDALGMIAFADKKVDFMFDFLQRQAAEEEEDEDGGN